LKSTAPKFVFPRENVRNEQPSISETFIGGPCQLRFLEKSTSGEKAKFEIFSRCKSHLDDADIVIALLDGSQVDDGTAWEIGYFFARKSPEQKIIGILTDFRRAGESEGAVVNPMIEGACDGIVRSREELVEEVFHLF
jgi:nucleoside 2-deoxyribosyltransferase